MQNNSNVMLKKGHFNWLIYFCYAIVLLHNSTPHCHKPNANNQVSEDAHVHHEHSHEEDHSHQHTHEEITFAASYLDLVNLLLNHHHSDDIEHEDDYFKILKSQDNLIEYIAGDYDDDDNKDYVLLNYFTFGFYQKNLNNYKHFTAPKSPPQKVILSGRSFGSSQLRAPPVLV